MAEGFYWFDLGARLEGSWIVRDRTGHITGARIFKYSYVVYRNGADSRAVPKEAAFKC
jgi:hypothetical protein